MKKFYNKTIMSRAFSSALRVFALLCVLLGVSSSAWGATVYFDNTPTNWDSVHVYVKNGTMWNGDNGVTTNGATHYRMSRIGTSNIWECNVSVAFTHICFMKDRQDNYGNIWQTEAAYYEGYTEAKPLLTPKDNNENRNGTKYYNGGSWSTYSAPCDNATTIYFKNTVNWSRVYAYLYDSEYWSDTNGSGSNGIKAGPLPMTSCSGTGNNEIYKVEYPSGHSGYISFTEGNQGNYNNFHNTKAAYRGDLCGDKPMYVPSTTSNGTWNGTTYYSSGSWETHSGDCDGGGSGGDDDDDVADCNSEEIQIWCKGKESYIDMWCYAWENGNDSNKPFGEWCGEQKQTTGSYNGANYAVWTVSGVDVLNVIFNNCGDAQTANLLGLEKGYRYIFDLAKKADGTSLDNWQNQVVYSQRIACGSGEVEEVHNGTIYLDVANLAAWTSAGAILKAKVTYKTDSSEELDLVQCAVDGNIFYVDQVLNLSNISKVQMLRYDPNNTSNLWNYTSELAFNEATPCVQLTGWVNGQGGATLTAYSGSCGISLGSPVCLTYDANVFAADNMVTLYGYLSETLCEAITDYGFVYCMGTATSGCEPTRNSPKLKADNLSQLYRGQAFQHTATSLPLGYTYGYKAYAVIGDMMYLSDETGYFRLADCTNRPEAGSPITITVNAALGEDFVDDCKLTYGSLKTAIDKLKASTENDDPYRYVVKSGSSYNLQQPVVINVHYYDDTPDDNTSAYIYRGTTSVGKYAGNNKPANSNLLDNFNYEGADPANTLTIKAGTTVAKPWVHHIVIRKSKNIVLDSLCIYSDPNSVGDNALEMDKDIASGDASWHTLNSNGYVEDANILVQNCMIGSDGFTGMHISSYDGVIFKNNDFESVFDDASSNAIAWGASAKFMWCKNIKFIQNNFRGDHATLMWIQDTQNMLVMNNVFWNTNKFTASSGQRNPSAMRLVTQFGNAVANVAFYYNTYFFADNGITSASTYDFMSFAEERNINVATTYFKYNNCYSYDEDCPGKSDVAFKKQDLTTEITLPDANFCGNNFWSEYDARQGNSTSAFAFGCSGNTFTNVKGEVCATTASGPASLIVKGSTMNAGSQPTEQELIGFTLTEDEALADRYYKNVRPDGSGWTYGAYQSKVGAPTDTIYWIGLSDDWDDRNNWEYETRKDPNDPNSAKIRQRVSCINNFSENLTAIIEEIGTVEVQGGRKWPRIPDSFTAGRSNMDSKEHVSAGLTSTTDAGMFAKKIVVEYGAGITGVENLKDGSTLYYGDAEVGFTAPRNQWILVGTVVKPWDNDLNDYRNVKSGDYFVKDHLPHVYMHQAKLTDGKASWADPFSSLEVEVDPTSVFAINIPDQYGKYKLPAAYYNPMYSTNYDPTEPIDYNNFVGRFVNEEEMPTYSDLTAGEPVLLNNSYPANVDARVLESETGGTVQYYNYDAGTFMNTSSTSNDVLLRPQHGFIFTPAAEESSLVVTKKMLVGGNTRSRSLAVDMPTFSLNLYNANTGVAYSNVVLRYDELKDVNIASPADVEKVFSPNVDAPELYIIANNGKYSRVDVDAMTQVIPLGIKLQKDMNVKFERAYFEGFNNVILTDTYTGAQYDLLRRSYTTEVLIAGDIEGRFYLNLEVRDNIVEEPDDNLTTDVEDATADVSSISIYVDDAADNTIRVVSNGTELETIYVSDMAGRTMRYDASGYAAALRLPVAQGVYMVHVIGESATKTEKVILK
ncbi:MAG: T9SS type A sorting domain-containing protein [Paludibacteraceae bacterium]|nr:T9SS type A sorting domain-containing protein [Paludibacteraceae bacterium]